MLPENRELRKRVLPEKYQGPVGRVRFAFDYTIRVGLLIINEMRGKPGIYPPVDKPQKP